MPNIKFYSLFFILFFVFFACSENEPDEIIDEVEVEEQVIINENSEVTAADTSSTGVYQEEVKEGESSLKDALKANAKEEIIEGGLSFCDCVKKQKALNDLIMETEDDAEMEKAMNELEDMKTNDCRILFSTKQNTIEEKQAHQQKVKRCL